MRFSWLIEEDGKSVAKGDTPREVLAEVLKDIIDGEWGPYPEQDYLDAADAVLGRLQPPS